MTETPEERAERKAAAFRACRCRDVKRKTKIGAAAHSVFCPTHEFADDSVAQPSQKLRTDPRATGITPGP